MDIVDVAIVGGGPAGMTAALVLGRSRKRVVVIDADAPRHAVAAGVHNLIAREGIAPAELRRQTWEQMKAYPSVERWQGNVHALSSGEGWQLSTSAGDLQARAVLLAVGVVDEHPAIPGFAQKWGVSIHHCPYCHGWEVRDQPLAVISQSEIAAHFVPLLRGWSKDVVVLTDGRPLADDVRAELVRREIPIYDAPIASLEGEDGALSEVVFEGGERLARSAMFVTPEQRPVPLIAGLDIALDGPFVTVDAEQRTSLPRLWAAGDCTTFRQAVALAAAQGMMAAVVINAELTVHP